MMTPSYFTHKRFFIKYSLILAFCCAVHSLSATTLDSLPYLTMKDTIFIHVNNMGVKTHHHIYKADQTLYSLVKFYGISMNELSLFNPNLNDRTIKVGQKIAVPIPNRAILRSKNTDKYNARTCIPVYHVVSSGETIYRLSHTLYHMPEDEIRRRSNLPNNNLKVGQKLRIGWLDITGIPPANEGEAVYVNPILQANLPFRNAYFGQIANRQEWEHKGFSVRQSAGKLKSGYVVFHSHAKINSYIRITNPMKGVTIYAKVIARIPYSLQHQYPRQDVIMAYTPTIGKALGVIDPQFFADIRFIK